MKKYLKAYNDNLLLPLITQTLGCIGIFGSFFVLIFGMQYLLIGVYMFLGGAVICGFNKIVDEMDFKETYKRDLDSIEDPQRKEMYRKMFK